MKTYHKIQKLSFFHFFLILLLSSPIQVSAADDCKGMVRDAEKLSKAIDDLEEATKKAETDLQEAHTARDKASEELDTFNDPQDPTTHGTSGVQRKKELTHALEKAEENLRDAKADYFDALQELIDQLQALKDLLDTADTQCKKELDAAERERNRNKLKDYQDTLDELRDQHNLEERAGEPEEPENTQKKQGELVDAELKALLEKILEELRNKYPEPEKFRSELRKKRQEIRNDWDDDFWDTPLGKLLKERLEKALKEIEDAPTGTPGSEEAPQESGEDQEDAGNTGDENSFRPILPRDKSQFGLGFSFGFTENQIKAWCSPETVSFDAAAPDQVNVITAVAPTQTNSQTDLSTGNTIENTSNFDVEKPSSAKICLDEWIAKPKFGLFLDIKLGRQWSGRIGAYQQNVQASPVTRSTDIIREDHTVYPQTNTLKGAIKMFEFQAGLLRYFGEKRIRPIVGIQGIYQLHHGTAVMDSEHQAIQGFSWNDKRWGAQALAGFQVRIFRQLDLGLNGQWSQYFASKNTASAAGFNVQLIWYP